MNDEQIRGIEVSEGNEWDGGERRAELPIQPVTVDSFRNGAKKAVEATRNRATFALLGHLGVLLMVAGLIWQSGQWHQSVDSRFVRLAERDSLILTLHTIDLDTHKAVDNGRDSSVTQMAAQQAHTLQETEKVLSGVVARLEGLQARVERLERQQDALE